MRTKNNSANLSLDIDILTRGPKNSINRNMIGDDGDFQAPNNNGSLDMTAQNLDFNNMAEVRLDNSPQSYSVSEKMQHELIIKLNHITNHSQTIIARDKFVSQKFMSQIFCNKKLNAISIYRLTINVPK